MVNDEDRVIPRLDGIYDRKLNATVLAWRDPHKMLVGYVYRQVDGNRAVLVYFSLDPDNHLTIRMHRTTVHVVNDPEYITGERLDSQPDPENDEKLDTYTITRKVLGF